MLSSVHCAVRRLASSAVCRILSSVQCPLSCLLPALLCSVLFLAQSPGSCPTYSVPCNALCTGLRRLAPCALCIGHCTGRETLAKEIILDAGCWTLDPEQNGGRWMLDSGLHSALDVEDHPGRLTLDTTQYQRGVMSCGCFVH